MPELPEVETTARGIQPHIEGKTLREFDLRCEKLRWPIDAELVDLLPGQRLRSVGRRGKYLLLRFTRGTLMIHLGMSGSLRVVDAQAEIGKHDHFDLVFSRHCVLRYRDPRRFGSLHWVVGDVGEHWLLQKLGPEPLSDAFDADYLYALSRRRKVAVKNFIMDSHVVVGVGNIYATEALFMTGIAPQRASNTVSKARYEALVDAIKRVLGNAIARGGTTLRDFVGGDGEQGYFAVELLAYGREGQPCIQCGAALKNKKIGQRASVYCSKCQT